MTKSVTTVSLQVYSTPAGAAVFVNDDYPGTTPSSLYVTHFPLGMYSISLVTPDYQPAIRTTEVPTEIINDLHVEMISATPGTTGQIGVGSSPSGATI
ncbi:MAG: PEGA domain-containing protein [Methanomicrobiales archaeon]